MEAKMISIAEWIILPKRMYIPDLYTLDDMQYHKRGSVFPLCKCREILSRRRGFICMTGAKKCPHCNLRVPAQVMRDFSRIGFGQSRQAEINR